MQKIKIGHRANFRAKNKCFRQILFPVRAILRSINFRYADFNTDSAEAPAKRSQHVNATYRNIVGRNMLLPFGHLVATCCVLLAHTWPVSNLSQQHPTCCNTSQHGGQTHTTCCAQQCWDMLRWHVAIVWPGLDACILVMACVDCARACS